MAQTGLPRQGASSCPRCAAFRRSSCAPRRPDAAFVRSRWCAPTARPPAQPGTVHPAGAAAALPAPATDVCAPGHPVAPFRHPCAHPPVARLPVCARQPWYLPQPLRNQPVAGLKRSCPLPHPQVCLGSLLQLVAITPPRHPTALKGSGQVGIATIEVADEVPTRRAHPPCRHGAGTTAVLVIGAHPVRVRRTQAPHVAVLRCFAPARFVAMPHRARPRLR